MSERLTEKTHIEAYASAVSRVIAARAGKRVRGRIHLGQTSTGQTTVWTPNGARHQAAALSVARRALRSAGYRVETFHGKASLPLAQHVYYLTVFGKVTTPSEAATSDD